MASVQTFFIGSFCIPYVQETRDKHDLGLLSPALVILDVFPAHRVDSVLQKLKTNGIRVRFVPGRTTGELKPLDVSGNGEFKTVNEKSI